MKVKKDNSLFEYYGFTKRDAKKYPVISGILKQLTPERIKKEIEEIQKVELPPELQKWVKEYEKVGERDEFIWKWAYTGWNFLTLPCVEKKYQKPILIIKTCNTILNTLIDDLADRKQDKKKLRKALAIISNTNRNYNVSNTFNLKGQKYLLLIKKIWGFIHRTIKNYPRYKEFKDIFEYDYLQFLNTMKYSYLINKKPNLINLTEHEIYSSHNMQGIIGFTLDLMCSPKFNLKELGILREISLYAQQMGRIGNIISTWEEEIYNNDFTSGIFAYALETKIIELKDLESEKKEIKKRIKLSGVENHFLKEWESHYNKICGFAKKIKSFDINRILKGCKKFLLMHLVCRGKDI